MSPYYSIIYVAESISQFTFYALNTNIMFEENFVFFHFSRLLSPKGTSATTVQAPIVAFTVFSLPRAWLEPRNTGRVNAMVFLD